MTSEPVNGHAEPQFSLGSPVRISEGVQAWLAEDESHRPALLEALRAHTHGDWGVVSAHDSNLMNACLRDNIEVMSVLYPAGFKVYVQTLSPLSAPETTVCTPMEY